MKANQYISRYAKHDTHFARSQDYRTRNLRWAHEPQGKITRDGLVFIGSVVAFVIAMIVVHAY